MSIEAVGVVDLASGTDLQPGQQVATLMGGTGRTFDGGYAEYTVVPRRQVIPFRSALPWSTLGADPRRACGHGTEPDVREMVVAISP